MLKRRSFILFLLAMAVFLARRPLLSATVSCLQLPMWLGGRVAVVLRDIADFPHLRRQNRQLRATVAQLTQQLTQLQETSRENERLRHLLDLRAAPASAWIAVRVVGVAPTPGTRAVILNQGARAGIRPETPVVVPEGLVGKVVQVNARSSLAILLTDPNFRAGCLIERSRETGILAGGLDGRVWVQLLPASADVAVGDAVLTSGLGGVFPKGLRIGTVRRVGVDSARFYKRVEVTPAAAMNRLEEALCQGTPP